MYVACKTVKYILLFHENVSVPTEAVAFLGAVGVFLILLIIFFLYLNKLLCFTNCGGLPCIDSPPKRKDFKSKGLSKLCLLSYIINRYM